MQSAAPSANRRTEYRKDFQIDGKERRRPKKKTKGREEGKEGQNRCSVLSTHIDLNTLIGIWLGHGPPVREQAERMRKEAERESGKLDGSSESRRGRSIDRTDPKKSMITVSVSIGSTEEAARSAKEMGIRENKEGKRAKRLMSKSRSEEHHDNGKDDGEKGKKEKEKWRKKNNKIIGKGERVDGVNAVSRQEREHPMLAPRPASEHRLIVTLPSTIGMRSDSKCKLNFF